MIHARYSLSFTTGALYRRESIQIAVIYAEINNWGAVRDKVISENLLQTRALNTAKRVCREIISRLKLLNPVELDLLIHGAKDEQAHLLWIAVCRRYQFIADFAVEVLRERYVSLQNDLHYEDFDYYLNKKAERHPELDAIQPSSRQKLRQVLFKMLKEADLLSLNNMINTAMLSKPLLAALAPERRLDALLFPVFESELKRD
jgi:hypothetical protein